MTRKEINSSLRTESDLLSGREYLRDKKQSAKEEEDRKAEQEKQNDLKDWQKISNQSMNFGRSTNGE